MRAPDRPEEAGGQLSPEEQRRMIRAALLRPMNLLIVAIGVASFALTFIWWVVPLTLATYVVLVFLAARDPVFRARTLEGRDSHPAAELGPPERNRNVSPERRARWLPRGETRLRVEEGLEIYRRTMFAIEESDDVTRAVLDDAVPKLSMVAERLVDVAKKRERVAEAIRVLETHRGGLKPREARDTDLEGLKKELRTADTEISDTIEKLSTLRARVVRVSVESGGAVQDAASKLNADLDELNLRLDALRSTKSPE
jgi:hypothetical protein